MTVVRGKVIDARTGEPIYNAHVYFTDENGNKYPETIGTITDFNGNYELATLGGYHLTVSHINYKNQTKPIDIYQFQSGGSYGQVINYDMKASAIQLPEVVIRANDPTKDTWFGRNKGYVLAAASVLLIGWVVKQQS